MVFHLKFECRFFLENPTYSGVIWTLYIFTVCWCADLCENSETFIMSSNRVVDVMEDPGYTHSARRPKSVATKTSCPWISEIGEPFRTRVSVDVGCVLMFFFSDFWSSKSGKGCKTHMTFWVVCLVLRLTNTSYWPCHARKNCIFEKKNTVYPAYPWRNQTFNNHASVADNKKGVRCSEVVTDEWRLPTPDVCQP